MLEHLVEYVIDLAGRAGHWSYLLLFGAAGLESAAFLGLLIPGESIVLAAGFLAAQRVLDLDVLIVTVAAGAIAGDSVGYEMGRRLGQDRLLRHTRWAGVNERRLQRARAFFERHGGKSVFFGRFVGFARALVPFIAGTTGMEYRRFLLANVLGASLWAALVTLAGYALGASWGLAEKWIGRASLVLAALFGLLFAISWGWRWAARHESTLRRLMERPAIAALRVRLLPAREFIAARLSPEGYLGLHFTVGVVVLVLASWLFGGVAEDVVHRDPLTRVDHYLAGWLADHSAPWLTSIMRIVSHVHDTIPTLVVTIGLASYLAIRRLDYWLLALVIAMPGGMLVNSLEKLAFQRARPTIGEALVDVVTYSFPSGHTTAATLLYGFLAVFLARNSRDWSAKVSFVAGAFLLVLVVAFSRMYLRVHYLSDVLAAIAGGTAWLALTFTGMHLLEHWRGAGRMRNG